MRIIGYLQEEPAAKTFGDWLYVQGIENHVEPEGSQGWAIWIKDEDRLSDATRMLQEFRANPQNPTYGEEARGAAAKRAEEEKGQAQWEKRLKDRRHLFRPMGTYGFGLLTFILIIISVAVSVLSSGGRNPQAVSALKITQIEYREDVIAYKPGLPEVKHGQVWRLITPIFIHFGIIHILFNMLWLKDLGSMVEGRQSTLFFAGFVLLTAAGSNLAQYYWAGPNFGGMSGVVYALLGYIWIRGKFDPGSGLFLPPATVIMMGIWFAAGVVGLLPGMANMAHGAGLAIGVAWGFLASQRYRR